MQSDGRRDRPSETLSEKDFLRLKKQITSGQRIAFTVASGSMAPVIKVGDFVEVGRMDSAPKQYDILVFWNGSILVCHYLLHINALNAPDGQPVYVTAGLANSRFEDLPVNSSHVLGKVVSHGLGRLTRLKMTGKAIWRRCSRF